MVGCLCLHNVNSKMDISVPVSDTGLFKKTILNFRLRRYNKKDLTSHSLNMLGYILKILSWRCEPCFLLQYESEAVCTNFNRVVFCLSNTKIPQSDLFPYLTFHDVIQQTFSFCSRRRMAALLSPVTHTDPEMPQRSLAPLHVISFDLPGLYGRK